MISRFLHASLLAIGVVGLVRPASAAPPVTPQNLTVRGTAPGQVTVTWQASTGATEYRVYADADGIISVTSVIPIVLGIAPNAHLVATVTGTTAVESGLPGLVRRFYAVVAVNDDGFSQPAFADWIVVPAEPDATIFGIADLHTHQFSNLGFGRRVVWGNAFSPAGLFDALPVCSAAHGSDHSNDLVGTFLRSGFPFFSNLGGDAAHPNGAGAQFDAWPAFDSYNHQQMYYDWVRRAFEGGLRLMVVHAVNNKLLCQYQGHDPQFSCEDMDTVDDQLQMAKNLEAFVDSQSGGAGLGWYRIAYSATEARHIINSGRMAVVLGLELDHLFNCGLNSSCTAAGVTTQLDAYYAKGVRHVFPVHVFDNAFGGAALYEPLFNWGNKLVENEFFMPRECSAEGYAYKQPAPDALLLLVAIAFQLPIPPVTTLTAECNSRALQPLGDALIRAMMTRKMILDIDHMSALTADKALEIAEEVHYPAVVAGHSGALSIASGQQANEGLKSPSQLSRLKNLGGMMGVGIGGNRADSTHPDGFLNAPGSSIISDCGWSTKMFAQTYFAGTSAFGGAATAAVGLGSDFNGLIATTGPRFGGKACWHDPAPSPQTGGVVYPFPIFAPAGVNAGMLGHATSPDRWARSNIFAAPHQEPWDYNNDGLAHIGLLPDFIADLRSVGMTDAQLQPLFRSAEAYIRMWERAEQINVNPPIASIVQSPAANADGWNNSDVTVSMAGTAAPGGSAVTSLTFSATGAGAVGPTSVTAATTQIVVSQQGVTNISVTAQDGFKNTSTPAALAVKLDKTAPSVSCQGADGTWHADDVSLACTASDGLSGLAVLSDATFVLSTTVPAGTETAAASTILHQVFDVAGNAATGGSIGGNKIDKKAPSISIAVPSGGNYTVNQAVQASYACADGGSGLASCAGPVTSGTGLDTTHAGTVSFVVSAADKVGNQSTATASYTVAYNVCPQYDASKVKRAGSVVPIKLQLCDAAGANLSAAGLTVTATNLVRVGTTVTGVLEDAGNANPDNNFRFDAGGYIFNLSTQGLSPGTWSLSFTVTGDPTVHSTPFQIQ